MNKRLLVLFVILVSSGLSFLPGTAAATDHSGTLTSDEIWDPADNPHYVIGNITVPAGLKLTILPDVEIFFKGNYYIRVAGEMQAEGTSAHPILFTRFDDTVTYWNELRFYTTGSGSLSYCTVEYAYSGIDLFTSAACTIDHCTIQFSYYYGIYYYQAAVNPGHNITNNTISNSRGYAAYFNSVTDAFLGSGNQITNNNWGIYFNNCTDPEVAAGNTISRNLEYGVYFGNSTRPVLHSGASECGVGVFYENCSDIGTIDNLTFSKNAESAVKVKNSGSFVLGDNNTITDNGWPLAIDVGAFPDPASQIPTSGNLRNAIQIVAGSGNKTGSWPNFSGLDYVLSGNNTIQSAGELTLNPGVRVRSLANIYIHIDGKLNAVGTEANQILFTRHGADSWGGLGFYSGSQGEIQHAIIEYGYYGVYQSLTASVPVSDCLFRHNTYGIYITSGTNVQVARSQFLYNNYGVYIAAGGTTTIGGTGDDFCCFKGNRDYAVRNLNAFTINAEYNYWGDPAGPNHPSHTLGRGDMVSDNVDFLPFSNACLSYGECISELSTTEIWIPSGGDVIYTWEALDGGTIIGSGASVVFDPPDSGPHPCPYHVKVTITSSTSGLSTSQTIGIYVKLAGDVNGDRYVNTKDQKEVRNHFGQSGTPGWVDADVNGDGYVNTKDQKAVRNQFGQTGCSCP